MTNAFRLPPYTRSVSELKPALTRLFGFEDFRPGQEQVVRAAVDGRDTLALMPTGSGKSLTYQLAAMLRPTPTLVLSPLIALMKDQVDKLPPEVAAQSTLINSSLSADEAAARLRGVSEGRYRMLYVAPERLRQRSFLEAIAGIDVGLVVIDEVHCVSMWGHDFRPDYLFIRRALDALGKPAILGMTATATPATEREIATALGREPEIVRTSVVRPNLRYDVELVDGEEARLRTLVRRLHELRGASAIVYARSRRSCETPGPHVARARSRGRPLPRRAGAGGALGGAGGVHRGPHPDRRRDDGVRDGDRQARHPPRRPLQLSGVARELRPDGRPGRPRRPRVRHAPAREPRRLAAAAPVRALATSRPSPTSAPSTRGCAAGGEISPEELRQRAGSARAGRDARAGRARPAAASTRAARCRSRCPSRRPTRRERIDLLLARYEQEALARADRLVRFAESRLCRHRQVAEHFGETLAEDCGMCDVCSPLAVAAVERGRDRAAPGRHRRRDPPRGARPALAARPNRPGGDAARLDERAPLGAALAPFGLLASATQAEVEALDPAARGRRRARGVRERRRLPAAAGGARSRAAADRQRRPAAGPADEGLFERLRAWRLERARVDEVPAYVVLHDATLRELATAKPASELDLAAVKGFGPTKLERYGEDVLAVIAARLTPNRG